MSNDSAAHTSPEAIAAFRLRIRETLSATPELNSLAPEYRAMAERIAAQIQGFHVFGALASAETETEAMRALSALHASGSYIGEFANGFVQQQMRGSPYLRTAETTVGFLGATGNTAISGVSLLHGLGVRLFTSDAALYANITPEEASRIGHLSAQLIADYDQSLRGRVTSVFQSAGDAVKGFFSSPTLWAVGAYLKQWVDYAMSGFSDNFAWKDFDVLLAERTTSQETQAATTITYGRARAVREGLIRAGINPDIAQAVSALEGSTLLHPPAFLDPADTVTREAIEREVRTHHPTVAQRFQDIMEGRDTGEVIAAGAIAYVATSRLLGMSPFAPVRGVIAAPRAAVTAYSIARGVGGFLIRRAAGPVGLAITAYEVGSYLLQDRSPAAHVTDGLLHEGDVSELADFIVQSVMQHPDALARLPEGSLLADYAQYVSDEIVAAERIIEALRNGASLQESGILLHPDLVGFASIPSESSEYGIQNALLRSQEFAELRRRDLEAVLASDIRNWAAEIHAERGTLSREDVLSLAAVIRGEFETHVGPVVISQPQPPAAVESPAPAPVPVPAPAEPEPLAARQIPQTPDAIAAAWLAEQAATAGASIGELESRQEALPVVGERYVVTDIPAVRIGGGGGGGMIISPIADLNSTVAGVGARFIN
jgi:hypothetical protein